jgi:hypothetical protein
MQRRVANAFPTTSTPYRKAVLLILESGFIYSAAWVRHFQVITMLHGFAHLHAVQVCILILLLSGTYGVYIFVDIVVQLTVSSQFRCDIFDEL